MVKNSQTICIMIVDDHRILRDGLRRLLEAETDLQVTAEASTGEEALELLEQEQPDILLLDLRLPDWSGLSLLEQVERHSPETKTIVLTAADDEPTIVQAMRRGASGIVFKSMATQMLIEAIHKVQEGGVWLNAQSQAIVMREFTSPGRVSSVGQPLSSREREIVNLVAKGYKNQEIAQALSITRNTVSNHIHNVFRKLNVSDRVQLALYAIQGNRLAASSSAHAVQ